MLDLQKMKTLIAISFISVAVSLVSGTEKLSFKDWHGFSNPFLSNTFPSLQRSAQKVIETSKALNIYRTPFF